MPPLLSISSAASGASDPLYSLAGLFALGVFAQWVASRVRIPAILFLLGAGLVLGPFTGILDPRELLGELLEPVVSIAVGIILFEGGLSLKLGEARKLGAPLYLLVFGGFVVTFALATVLAHYVGGLSLGTSAVLGAVLIVTGPTVIKPMLRQARLRKRPALLLKWESIINDALGALLAVIVVEIAFLTSQPDSAGGGLWVIPIQIFGSGVAGGLAAWVLGRGMDTGWIPEHLKVPAIFGGVVGVFAIGEMLFHEAGLLAVTVMGVVLGNIASPSVEAIRHFKEDMTTILVAFLFLILSADLRLEQLETLTLGAGLFVVCVLFVVRPLTAWLALTPSGIPWQERAFIGWIAPRGVVAAAMGGALQPRLQEAGYADAELLVPVLFAIILATVTLHGLTVRPWARKLGVAAEGEGGLLIVGVDPWVLDLARTLSGAGVEVALVDHDFRRVSRARLAGLDSEYGDILSEDTLDELPLEQMRWVLAATDDDHYNALVCVALSKIFGRERTLQVTSASDAKGGGEPHLQGRMPWGAHGRFNDFAFRGWRGGRFKTSTLTAEWDWKTFLEEKPGALPLFAVSGGRLTPLEESSQPGKDALIVYFAGPA